MRKRLFIAAAISAALFFTSCITAPVCVTSSVTPMNGKVVSENLGKTEGTDTAFSVLGLYMIGRPDLDLAIKEAVSSKNADTLINVSCYERYMWFLIFSATTVKVEGEAVRLVRSDAENDQKKNESGRGKKK